MTPDAPLSRFFEIAKAAVFEEDRWLRETVTERPAYHHWYPGITCLYETGTVQLILRALWREGFPFALGWEVPYPEWPHGRLDLAVYGKAVDERVRDIHDVVHAIEVKWWIDETAKTRLAIWADFFKLMWFTGARRCNVLLLTAGETDLGQDVAWLCQGGYPAERSVAFKLSKLGISDADREWTEARFGGATEVLSDERASPTIEAADRRLRVSLIEVQATDARPPPA